MSPQKIILGLVGAAALVLGAVLAVTLTQGAPRGPQTAATTSTGEAAIGGAFTLTDQDGDTFTEADLEGRPSLIYFGYTYCPDVCPFSLQTMKAAIEQLPERQQDRIRPVFITVDPARDTVEAVSQYVQSEAFPKGLVGLTGTEEQVEQAKEAYKVYSARAETEGSMADYLVDHTSMIYFMDEQGRFVNAFSHGESPETIAAELARWFKANS